MECLRTLHHWPSLLPVENCKESGILLYLQVIKLACPLSYGGRRHWIPGSEIMNFSTDSTGSHMMIGVPASVPLVPKSPGTRLMCTDARAVGRIIAKEC